jgi:hypothetical protein
MDLKKSEKKGQKGLFEGQKGLFEVKKALFLG